MSEPSARDTEVGASRMGGAEPTALAPGVHAVGPKHRGAGPADATGRKLGRYDLERRLGAGGMGEVYQAYDPELARTVAIKLLRPELSTTDAESRFAREAKATAQLNHPNVVSIYDVGRQEGRVYLAMEYIEGETLRGWAQTPRSWREVVQVFYSAGQGLATAHAAGLVHRDFKPENVMVASDGRVVVMDFGLVRAAGDPGDDENGNGASPPHGTSLGDMELTAQGSIMGTPAFMAPEQFERADVGPAADQFSYCLSMWLTLYGKPPYPGATAAERVYLMSQGELDPPGPSKVPGWLRRVLVRGLSAKEADRFPGMNALLAALARGRRKWIFGVVGGLIGLGAAAAVGFVGHQRWQLTRCEGTALVSQQLWADHRPRVIQRTETRPELWAADAMRHVDAGVNRWAEGWTEARIGLCSGDLEARDLEHARWCLDRDLVRVEGLLKASTTGPVENTLPLADLVWEFPSAQRCLDRRHLVASEMPDPSVVDSLEELDSTLASALVEAATGRNESALVTLEELEREAEMLAYAPFHAEVAALQGRVLLALGENRGSAEKYEQGYLLALSAPDDSMALRLAASLIHVYAAELGDVASARLWSGHADALLSRGADGYQSVSSRVSVLMVQAQLEHREGNFEPALRRLGRALDLAEENYGRAHPMTLSLMIERGTFLYTAGRSDQAVPVLESALFAHEEFYGPHHPSVARVLTGLATARFGASDLRGAKEAQLRALELRREAYGDDSTLLIPDLNNLAMFSEYEGDTRSALGYYERLLEACEEADPLTRATASGNAAMALSDLGRHDAALEQIEDSEIALRRAGDGQSVAAGWLGHHYNEGYVLRSANRWEEAESAYTKGVERAKQVAGEDHDLVALGQLGLARSAYALGRFDDARDQAERALATWSAAEHPRAGQAKMLIGMVLAEQQGLEAGCPVLGEAAAALAAAQRPEFEIAEGELQHARCLAAAGETERATAAIGSARDRLSGWNGAVLLRSEIDELVESLAHGP